MDINFPGPVVPMQDGGISYRAIVDDTTVSCQFSWEALQDINPKYTLAQPMEQFQSSKVKLLTIAEKKIRAGGVVNGVVYVGKSDI